MIIVCKRGWLVCVLSGWMPKTSSL